MKKGFIRSLEAVIAIVVFLIFFYSVMSLPLEKLDTLDPIQYSLKVVVERVLYNETLRQAVLQQNDAMLESLLNENIPPAYEHLYLICNQANCVSQQIPFNKEIFVDDVYVTSTYSIQDPKIFRVYAWKK